MYSKFLLLCGVYHFVKCALYEQLQLLAGWLDGWFAYMLAVIFDIICNIAKLAPVNFCVRDTQFTTKNIYIIRHAVTTRKEKRKRKKKRDEAAKKHITN